MNQSKIEKFREQLMDDEEFWDYFIDEQIFPEGWKEFVDAGLEVLAELDRLTKELEQLKGGKE